MKTSLEQTLNTIEWNFENISNLMIAFQEASITSNNDVTVKLKDKKGVVTEHKVSSFQNILSELKRIDNNFKSLLNNESLSYIVNSDGSVDQVNKTSFINAYIFDDFVLNEDNLIIDKNSLISNFLYPNVKLPITLNIGNKPVTSVHCEMYDIISGYDKISNNTTLVELKYLISSGTVVARSEEFSLNREKQYSKYSGKFSILDIKLIPNQDNQFYLTLDDIKYKSINTIDNSYTLKVNDILAFKDGNSLYQIIELDNNTKVVRVQRTKGTSIPAIGINNLFYNEIITQSTDEIIVGLPIKPNKQFVAFLYSENILNIGFPTEGIKIDTNSYEITYNEESMTLDVFFSKYVTNFSDYLTSIINDTTIPYSLGIKPVKPVLKIDNFNVIQINKHLTTSQSALELEKLNESKQSTLNAVQFKNQEIAKVQNEIDTVQFKTPEEKKYRQEKIQTLRNDINILNQNILNITRNIDSNAVKLGLKNVKPKYRLIGVWDLAKPIISSNTKQQYVIGYEIEYRYLSKNVDTVESTNIKMVDANGNNVNIAISPWNRIQSRILNKNTNNDGTVTWETPALSSTDDININQLSISMTEGESIEVKVRAISEAGYPISSLKSDWSEIIRYDFPQSLTDNSLFTLIENNTDDLQNSELVNLLNQNGITTHVADIVQEAERLFHHKAENITSGFFTEELKNIPLSTFLKTLRNDLDLVLNKDNNERIKVSVVGFNNEEFLISNNTTLELDAGNYSDTINLVDSSKFGNILKKRGYIKIRNNSQLPLEIKSLNPGTIFDQLKSPRYYKVPVIFGQDSLQQAAKQIIYFRDTDLTGQSDNVLFKLIEQRLPNTQTYPNPADIDGTVIIEENKNIIYLENGVIKKCALTPNTLNEFIVFTKDHPMNQANDIAGLIAEFDRVTNYTRNLKIHTYQDAYDFEKLNLGYKENDIYLVGKNSCGAWLYPIIQNPEIITVVGNSTTSTLIIDKESEILIPFIYEYRMMDRLGYVDGNKDLTTNDELIYNKKIGVDMLINNEIFKFDINVTSKLKPKITPLESLNLTSVVGAKNSNISDNILN